MHRRVIKRVGGTLLAAAAVCCLGLVGSGAALAGGNPKLTKEQLKALYMKFVDCPVAQGEYCTYGETLSGEFKIGSKVTPIEHPTILQGGLKSLGHVGEMTQTLIPPLFGAEEVSKTPQTIPGGLTGTGETGGPVTATAELIKGGTVLVAPGVLFGHGTAVTLPIKVHLQNEQLGENCYIGSDENPIVLHLTDSYTEPPEGTEPIEGKRGTIVGYDKGRILELHENTLVDNTWAAPAATGCGTSPLDEAVVTAAVNANAGLPSAAGKNVAILNGNVLNAQSKYVLKADKKEIKAKEAAAKAGK